MLGWLNARVHLSSDAPLDGEAIARRFLEIVAELPVAHVKLTSLEPPGGHAALVRRHDAPSVRFEPSAGVREASWLVNARVAMDPAQLAPWLERALASAAAPATVEWREVEAFRPSRPVPRHRYTFRCGSESDSSCCAAFYDRADVRALLGDSWHPGGLELTLAVGERLGLASGARVLDVACGKGTSLLALEARFGVQGVGMDARARPTDAATPRMVRGDAHQIPFEGGSFDAVVCECALSTFHDQLGALREMERVLKPGGRLAVTDMSVEGTVPETLSEWVHTGTCLSGALTAEAYGRALEEAGLTVLERWDASDALFELLRRIKRNLVGAALGAASGALGDGVRIDVRAARDALREATRAVEAGAIRYVGIIAEKSLAPARP
ncbi:MAG: class I SAM-dependent methyltransferase [Polyangiaceae bacterium]|nr:class I SAM-dependent methyltransferase [Polyangiaceae bacterium]